MLHASHPEHGIDNVYTGGEAPLELRSIRASPDLFPLLGVEPALGRVFSNAEGVVGNHRVVLLSHGFWQNELGGSREVLGQVMNLDAEPHEVVGVMPPGFEFPPDYATQVWSSRAFDPDGRRHDGNRNVRRLAVVARMRRDTSLEQVRQELDRLAASLAAEYPGSNAGWTVRVGA